MAETIDGLAIIDKPAGWTSHDVVARMRRIAGTRKVGHAGTLDPMATGVLVLGLGRATRLLTYIVGATKEYDAVIRLGQASVTDDAEGEITATTDAGAVTDEALESVLATLRGDIDQVPSSVSAIKVDGKRSYARVRGGEEVKLKARPITISQLTAGELSRVVLADGTTVVDVPVHVECSSGTYIRALARDIGQTLGVGGHLTYLRRSRVGSFTEAAARTLKAQESELRLLGLDEAMAALFDTRGLSAAETRAIRYGQTIAPGATPGIYAAFSSEGKATALIKDNGEHAKPILVVDPA